MTKENKDNKLIRRSPAFIESDRKLSLVSERILVQLIRHAQKDLFDTEFQQDTHILSFKEVKKAAGWEGSYNYDLLKRHLMEIKNMPVVNWDVLGKYSGILESIKKRAFDNFDVVIENPGFMHLKRMREFNSLLESKKALEDVKKRDSTEYKKTCDKILDMMFPQFVANSSIFSLLNFHKGGTIAYQINPSILTLVVDPFLFSELDNEALYYFKSRASWRIYELACLHRDQGETGFITIDDFRKVSGIPEGKYIRYSTIKNDYIIPAIKECHKAYNEGIMDVVVNLEEDKSITKGKAVDLINLTFTQREETKKYIRNIDSGIQFKFDLFENDRGGDQLSLGQIEVVKKEAKKIAPDLCNKTFLKTIYELNNKGFLFYEYIIANLNYCAHQNNKRASKGMKGITGGYLISAIKENYAGYTPKEKREEEKRKETKDDAERESLGQIREEADRIIEVSKRIIETGRIDSNEVVNTISKYKNNPLLTHMISSKGVPVDPRLLAIAISKFKPDDFLRITGFSRCQEPHRLTMEIDKSERS